ncbi:MAG TPA: tol-pal system protein YbgF [Ottowia sp.]|uniref:tol-pal system protein YbgF n=1 Tax=Ottowia sp. TaxID=1898956 RepID=UPI002B5C74B8|nr:tol-pal system protein YbgF [Ottowia sp.]HMN21468.1 tol-pal system protein YbgF [Ottowia sp.]
MLARSGLGALALVLAGAAQAQIFGGDDQARQAILDLRQRFDQAVTAQNRLVEENTQLRRSMLELQQQLELLRGELAQARGQDEQLTRDVSELRNRVEALDSLDERLQRLETGGAPAAGEAGGAASSPDEKRDYEAALAVFRSGDYAAAQVKFADYVKRYPSSSLAPAALFWLGNAQYATRNYKEAITNFRSLLAAAPNHAKAPEALLSIANCQIELKETNAARATLESLAKTYPQSEAAQAGRERLAKLK